MDTSHCPSFGDAGKSQPDGNALRCFAGCVPQARLAFRAFFPTLFDVCACRFGFGLPTRLDVGDYSKLYEANHSSLRIRGFALSRSNALEEVMMDVIPLSQLEGADIADLREVVSAPAAPGFQMKKGNAGGGEIQMSIADVAEGSVEEAAQTPIPALRENFAETAFFYPNLRTDSLGNVSISFTVPDALTQWRFLGFAHTQEVDYALWTDTVQTSSGRETVRLSLLLWLTCLWKPYRVRRVSNGLTL